MITGVTVVMSSLMYGTALEEDIQNILDLEDKKMNIGKISTTQLTSRKLHLN